MSAARDDQRDAQRDDRREDQREAPVAADQAAESLLPADSTERYREEWEVIQRDFVDKPRSSVEQADKLVDELMQRLSATFANERNRLESQWERDEDVSTEDLRLALTRYRSFFERLLSA
jgi:polyhydroxyalkanoate synthesis regulator phasin